MTATYHEDQLVAFKKIDLYDYFRISRGFDQSTVEAIFLKKGIQEALALYMFCGLPLAATVIYFGHEMSESPNLFGQPLSFTPGYKRPSVFGKDTITGRPYGLFCGDVVKHLARYVTTRRSSIISNFKREALSLSDTSFPSPLTEKKEIHQWMNELGLYYHSPDYYNFWNESDDFPEYLAYWTKAFWNEYVNIFKDEGLFKSLQLELDSSYEIDAFSKVESEMYVETPFLNKQLRMMLLSTVYKELKSGLVDGPAARVFGR